MLIQVFADRDKGRTWMEEEKRALICGFTPQTPASQDMVRQKAGSGNKSTRSDNTAFQGVIAGMWMQ